MNKNVFFALLLAITGCNKTNKSNQAYSYYSDVLTVTPDKYDFGDIEKKGKLVIPFSFKIKSKADSTIYIKKVDVSCHCLSIDTITTIYPNHENELKGTIDISNLSGHINKTIFVNYGEDEVLLLRIKGDIIE